MATDKKQPEPMPDPKSDAAASTKPGALPADLQREADDLLREVGQADVGQPGAPGEPAPASQVETGAVLTDLLQITFNGLVAPRRGTHWEMTADECKSLGYAYGAVIDKYFPNLDAGVELTAIIVTVAVIGPRVAQDAATAKKRKPAAATTAVDGGSPGTPPTDAPADLPKGDDVFAGGSTQRGDE